MEDTTESKIKSTNPLRKLTTNKGDVNVETPPQIFKRKQYSIWKTQFGFQSGYSTNDNIIVQLVDKILVLLEKSSSL